MDMISSFTNNHHTCTNKYISLTPAHHTNINIHTPINSNGTSQILYLEHTIAIMGMECGYNCQVLIHEHK